jgi:photosystem II Psb28-2 protein
MTSPIPKIEFFEGISEELSDVSLRRNRSTGLRSIVMTFKQLKSLERFNSFTKKFAKAMQLIDEEGAIAVEPDGIKFIFGGPEGDELERVECKIEIDRDDHWERLMRFLHRYAEANGMSYGENTSSNQ